MMKLFFILILSVQLLLGGCSSAPRQELQKTKKTIERAHAIGAPEFASTEYHSATSALHDAEILIERRKYRLASEVLGLARGHARRAIALSEEELRQQEEQASAASADQPAVPPRKPSKKSRQPVKAEPQPAPPAKKAEPTPLPLRYAVAESDTLWLIAARQDVYGDPLLWPLLYRANRDQIRDPRQIHTGQILDIPRDVSPAERKEAIDRAQSSEIFPVNTLLQHRPSHP